MLRVVCFTVILVTVVALCPLVATAEQGNEGSDIPIEIDGKLVKSDRFLVKKDGEIEVREVRKVTKEKKKEIEEESGVEYVEYDGMVYPGWVPNDPKAVNDGDRDQDNLTAVNAFKAWDKNKGGNVTAAVLDSGCRSDHEDLAGKVSYQYDTIYEDNVADDTDGHGTPVASILAANTNNSKGIAGGAPNTNIACIKVFDETHGWYSDVIQGLDKAQEAGAGVVNMSLVFPSYSQAMQDKILEHQDAYIVVACAGNYDQYQETQYPAAYDKVVAVSGTTENGTAFWSDSPGYPEPYMGSSWGPYVDVAAPAIDVWAAFSDSTKSYGISYGTSMAAPHVAAAIALRRSERPARLTETIRDEICDDETRTGTMTYERGPTGYDEQFGCGLINFNKMVS